MCVILLFFHVHPDLPLVVAANRDEFYERRSSGPEWLFTSPRVVGGRDLRAGGTWMGVSETGFFAGLTNLRTLGPPEAARRSRGEIVMQALRTGSVRATEAWIRSVDARAYNPYNLVFGDGRELWIASSGEDDASVRLLRLKAGLHVITNAPVGTRWPKVSRAEKLAAPLSKAPLSALVPALAGVLADHRMPALRAVPVPPAWLTADVARKLQSLCVHTPSYGTRSSTVVAIGSHRVVYYGFADGPPCTTRLVDRTAMAASGGSPSGDPVQEGA
ncbi:MAG TPA: NRDE family protein [Polyangiaceae bacterium]|nr:NRDE family protein [Polyangiaceae bacterium]